MVLTNVGRLDRCESRGQLISDLAKRRNTSLEVAGSQIVRPGPPQPSIILRPGIRALAAGEERYTVPGAGVIAIAIHAGDHVRLVDVEGMQRCEWLPTAQG